MNMVSSLFILHVCNLALPNTMILMAYSEDYIQEAPLYAIFCILLHTL
jgi:hypothetical protein